MFNTICSDEIKEYTHLNNKNSFTRKRKIPLNDKPILWNGYLVFAIDGSKAEVPNSYENKKVFGESCIFEVKVNLQN